MTEELTTQLSEKEALRDTLKETLVSLVETRQDLETQLVQKKTIAPPVPVEEKLVVTEEKVLTEQPPIEKPEVAEKAKITIPKCVWPVLVFIGIITTLGVVAIKQTRKEKKSREKFLHKRISSYF